MLAADPPSSPPNRPVAAVGSILAPTPAIPPRTSRSMPGPVGDLVLPYSNRRFHTAKTQAV